MHSIINGQQLKRYTRFILGLFILSVINMGIQLPAHGAMSLKMQPAQQGMMQMDSQGCECPPVLCESVSSQAEQLSEGSDGVSFNYLTGFQTAYSFVVDDSHHQQTPILLDLHDRRLHYSIPTPLSITSILHI